LGQPSLVIPEKWAKGWRRRPRLPIRLALVGWIPIDGLRWDHWAPDVDR